MEFSIKNKTVILLIGPTECGKSTFAQKESDRLKEKGIRSAILSSDENRLFLAQEDLHKHNAKMMPFSKGAFDLLYNQLNQHTSWPVNTDVIFVDATHLSKHSREPILEIAAKNNYNVAAVVFKYNNNDAYFEHCSGEKWLVRKHVDKFHKETIRNLNDIKEKFFIKHKRFEEYQIEISDFLAYKANTVSENDGPFAIIGDIHGCVDKLKLAIEYCQKNSLVPILLGDIVDKNSKENIEATINFLFEYLQNNPGYLVCGNHDRAVYGWLVQNGLYTKDIIEQYFESALYLDGQVKARFIHLVETSHPFLLHEDLKFIATHAPCQAKYLGKLDKNSLKNQRTWRYPKKEDGETREEWSKRVLEELRQIETNEFHFPTHFFGHVASLGYIKEKSYSLLDTGACYGNFLTLYDCQARRYIKFGEKQDNENLLNPAQERKEVDLDQLEPRERGRVLWAAKNGLPITSSTMSPADKSETELESLEWALNYYEEPVLQIKYMGSWSCIRLKQDPKECKTFSRNGYLVKKEGLEEAYLSLIEKLSWHGIEEYVIGAELMPWRFLGDSLIDKEFAGLGFLTAQQIAELKNSGFIQAYNTLKEKAESVKGDKKEVIAEHGHHIWSTKQVYDRLSKEQYHDLDKLEQENNAFIEQVNNFGGDCKPHFKPFSLFKIVCNDGTERIRKDDNLAVFNCGLNNDPYHLVDKSQENWMVESYSFFENVTTARQEEGVVVKPLNGPKPGQAPFLKVRSPEYLRLAYGFDYQLHLDYHRNKKNIGRKLKESIKDWNRGIDLLNIHVEEIDDKNQKAVQIIADFVVGEKRQQNIDPRL